MARPHRYDWDVDLNLCPQTRAPDRIGRAHQSPVGRGEAETPELWQRNRRKRTPGGGSPTEPTGTEERGEAGRSGGRRRCTERAEDGRKEPKMSGRNRGLAKGEAWAPRNGRGGKWRREPSQVLPGKDGGPGRQKEERLARQEREAEATVAENRATVPCGRSPGGGSPSLPGAPARWRTPLSRCGSLCPSSSAAAHPPRSVFSPRWIARGSMPGWRLAPMPASGD